MLRQVMLWVAATLLLAGCGADEIESSIYQAIVADKNVEGAVPVYSTLQAALDDAPEHNDKPWKIFLKPGRYHQKLLIDKPFIHLYGSGAENTFVSYDDYAGKLKADGSRTGTTGSASVTVTAPHFAAFDLTIENTFDYPGIEALPEGHSDKVKGMQAVALKLAKGSDNAHFERVTFNGYQDTLYTNAGSSYFKDCTVTGHIDFIFGAGQAWFENCDIISRARLNNSGYSGYITAASTQLSQSLGLVFNHCRLLHEPGVPDHSVPLGRPWHPTTTFADGRYADPNAVGHVVFMNSYLDKHISIEGWTSMGGTKKGGGKKPFMPEDARFFEYNNHGPGALVNSHRRQLQQPVSR